MKHGGMALVIISSIAIAFIIFNNIFQTFEFLVKYQVSAFILFITLLIISVAYTIIEVIDGKGW